MRRLLVVLAVVTLVGAACGGDETAEEPADTTAAESPAGGETVTVEVDARSDEIPMGTISYFPDTVTLRPGDTVKFHSNDTEPHSVTFGTIVDAGIKAFKSLPPEALQGPPDPSKMPPELAALEEKIPSMLPEGPGDANQVSVNPCFLASGDPPEDPATPCPKMVQPEFDGKHAIYSSGYLPDDAEFTVNLADDIAPGEYSWFCTLHRFGMTGTLTVVPEGQEVPSADEVEQAGDKQREEIVAKLKPQHERLEKTTPDKASAGAPPLEGEEEVPAQLLAFYPEELSVPADTPVTWTVFGFHTVSFNAPEDAVGSVTKAPDGTFHVNEKAVAPAGGPGAPPPPEGEPKPDAKPIVVDGGRFDGTGFRSSGMIPSFGPPGYQYKLTFTKAGSYPVRCLIHPDMKGTVKVT